MKPYYQEASSFSCFRNQKVMDKEIVILHYEAGGYLIAISLLPENINHELDGERNED